MGLVVAKVGGSLYDLPDLADRLRTWAAGAGRAVLFVPGGGAGADVIRGLDRLHAIGDHAAHGLALRVLTVNAHLLAELLSVPVRHDLGDRPPEVAVLEPFTFCQADEGRPGALPQSWKVTSDAIAARVAELASADLALLKSVEMAVGMNWQEAAAAGLVDETFPSVAARARLRVEWVNLRSRGWCPGSRSGVDERGRR